MTRGKALLGALVLAGAAATLSACTADPDYDPSQFAYGYPVYGDPPYGYPGFGYFDFDHWGADCHRHGHWRDGHR